MSDNIMLSLETKEYRKKALSYYKYGVVLGMFGIFLTLFLIITGVFLWNDITNKNGFLIIFSAVLIASVLIHYLFKFKLDRDIDQLQR
jgi:predicted HAD superfamily hydrolase